MARSVRILIVDDFEPWRRFLCSYLQEFPTWQVIGQAADGLEAINKSRELQPDLILLDVGLPHVNGIEASRQILELSPRSKILFLSEQRCPEIVRAAMNAGGSGYVVKSNAASDLIVALRAVIANKQFISLRFLAQDLSGASDS
jgi:DNA-binding NarL/FixJ family response regulator